MRLTLNYKTLKKAAALPATLLVSFAVHAQDVAAPSGGETPVNWLLILLVFVSIVLLVVIYGLGQVILLLGRQMILKKRKEFKPLLVIAGLLLFGTAEAQSDPSSATSVVTNYGGLKALEFYTLAAVIMIELIVIFYLAFIARRMYREVRGIADELELAVLPQNQLMLWWKKIDKLWMTQAVPVEKEADILLDHDYDGIRELDNSLPPWWKYGFYVTIVAAVIYLMNFHVLGIGKNPEQEYAAQMQEGKLQEEAYKAKTKNLIDEDNVKIADAAGTAEGKKIYLSSCVACHGPSGEGGIGPNLTDEYWLHGGSMNDIYKTIKLGYPEKGMQSWQAMFSPVQMNELASYVKSLKGTKPPNPKAPQGEPFKE